MRRTEKAGLSREALLVRVTQTLQKRVEGCKTTASVLQALGVAVEGGEQASDEALQKALKRAKLQFHPDRHALSPLEERLLAEESFKVVLSTERNHLAYVAKRVSPELIRIFWYLMSRVWDGADDLPYIPITKTLYS